MTRPVRARRGAGQAWPEPRVPAPRWREGKMPWSDGIPAATARIGSSGPSWKGPLASNLAVSNARVEGPTEFGTFGLLKIPLRKTSVFAMDQPAGYLHWGFILISWPNLLVIGLMVVLFALALILPFPGHGPSIGEEKKV